jgi:hypothetical protein
MAVKRAVIAVIIGQFGCPRGTAGRVAGSVLLSKPDPTGRRGQDWKGRNARELRDIT